MTLSVSPGVSVLGFAGLATTLERIDYASMDASELLLSLFWSCPKVSHREDPE